MIAHHNDEDDCTDIIDFCDTPECRGTISHRDGKEVCRHGRTYARPECPRCGHINLPDGLIVVNCHGCKMLLRAKKQPRKYRATNLTREELERLPDEVGDTWRGRVYCAQCYIYKSDDGIYGKCTIDTNGSSKQQFA
jgi:hypothetical protein